MYTHMCIRACVCMSIVCTCICVCMCMCACLCICACVCVQSLTHRCRYKQFTLVRMDQCWRLPWFDHFWVSTLITQPLKANHMCLFLLSGWVNLYKTNDGSASQALHLTQNIESPEKYTVTEFLTRTIPKALCPINVRMMSPLQQHIKYEEKNQSVNGSQGTPPLPVSQIRLDSEEPEYKTEPDPSPHLMTF